MICKLTDGLDGRGRAVHITEAARGSACGLVCPGCMAALTAKKGDKTQHHFAHDGAAECPHGFTNSLYYALKRAADELGYIALPAYKKNTPIRSNGENIDNYCTLINPTRVRVDRTDFAKKGGVQITGLLLYCSGKPLFLRLLAGYSEPRSSFERIKAVGLPVVEIDLSRDDTLTPELAREYIGSQSDQKYWIYNALAEDMWQKKLQSCDRLKVEGEKEKIFTYGCPVMKRREDGMICYIRKGCAGCPRFYGMYGTGEDRYILCLGRK